MGTRNHRNLLEERKTDEMAQPFPSIVQYNQYRPGAVTNHTSYLLEILGKAGRRTRI